MAILTIDNDGLNAGPFAAAPIAASTTNATFYALNMTNSVLRFDIGGPVAEVTANPSSLTVPANSFVEFTASNSDTSAHTVDFSNIRTAHGTSAQTGQVLVAAVSA